MSLIFTWDDIKQILWSKRRVILRWTTLATVATFFYFLFAPLEYEAWATFKRSPSRGEQTLDLNNLIRSFSPSGSEGSSIAIMLSDAVLEKTAEKLGLQVEFTSGSRWGSIAREAYKNLLAECGIKVQDTERPYFSSVVFPGEKVVSLRLKKVSDSEYHLFDKQGQFLAHGVLGRPLVCPDFQLTVDRLPSTEQAKVLLHPIQTTTAALRKKLTIKQAREDKNLLLIRCRDSDRRWCATLVNTLMSMYEKYLIEENKLVVGAQLSYLSQRQDELSAKLDHDIQDHAKMLQKNLQTQGFLGIKDEMEYVLDSLQQHKLRSDEIQLELRQMQELLNRVALEAEETPNKPDLIERFSKVLADQIGSAQKMLEQVKRKEKIEMLPSEELRPVVDEFNRCLDTPNTERLFKTETVLQDFMSQLKGREKSLRESSQWIQIAQNDLLGMNLESAKRQFSQYSTQFDDLHGQLKQVMFMRDRLFDPSFEISTLGAVLGDSVSQQMIQRSSELEAQLHDHIHHSSRDRERLRATLAIHKQFLKSHLDQTLQLGKIRIDLVKEKLSSLHKTIHLLLTQEQAALDGKISELKETMQSLPQLWVHENSLKFKSDLTKGMMEGLVGIAETKNLAHHLYQVESRPLDKAKPPLSYVKPWLVAKSLSALFLSATFFALLALLHAFIRRFPASLETLRAVGAHISGPLSCQSPLSLPSVGERDLETLRKIAAFLLQSEKKKSVALIGEKQTLFFPALTQLLKKQQKTSCVIDCSFGKITSSEERQGLFHILNGTPYKEVISTRPSYDYIPAGAFTTDGVELLTSSSLDRLAAELSEQYDFLFFVSRTPLHALESDLVAHRCSHVILVAESPLGEIQPFLDRARQKENKYVTFVQYPLGDL